MLQNQDVQNINLKKKSESKLIDNIIKYQKTISNLDLFKLLHRKPQKIHQLYRKNAMIMQEDDEKYNGFFSQMNNYNQIQESNILEYKKKKEENKNFLKQYRAYKLYNLKICKDDKDILFENLLPLYNKKNIFFSDKFFSNKSIFKESGLLITDQKKLRQHYKKDVNLKNSKEIRDISYINHLNMYLDKKIEDIKNKKLEKDDKFMEMVGHVKKSVTNMMAKYKRTKEYKLKKRLEAMKALELFRLKEMEFEKDKKYIQEIKNLIKLEEKERQTKLNNSNSNHSYNNNETESNNSLFILNRYPNKRYNNKINASNILQKNKSSTNIQSSLYNNTTNSSINNNETKFTTFINKRPIKIIKRNSINTYLDNSEYTLENNFNNTNENKDNTEYINIMDSSKVNNPINTFKQIKNMSNNYSTIMVESKNKKLKNRKSLVDKNEEISSLTHNDDYNTKNGFLSEITNLSTHKKGRNLTKNLTKKTKSTSELIKYDIDNGSESRSKNLSTFNHTLDDKEKKCLNWNLFKNLYQLNHKVHTKNNLDFKNFYEKASIIPTDDYQNITSKINKSFELDDELKKAHINYVKLLMKEKIKNYYDRNSFI